MVLCYAPARSGPGYLRYTAVRDVNLLYSATWRRQCESDYSRFVILLHGAGLVA